MNKEVRKVKLISKNVLESVAYYSRFNPLYLENAFLKAHNEHFNSHKFEFPKKTDIVPLYTYLFELAYHNRLNINGLNH